MILQDLYNRVMGFFRQTDIEQKESTKETACNRLRVVLMQDRTNLTPELMERMRREMVELLSRYVEMDKEALELNLEQDGEQVALMLSIPVIRAKDEEEIKAALAEEDAKKAKLEEVESDETEVSEDNESLETEDKVDDDITNDDEDVEVVEDEEDESDLENSEENGENEESETKDEKSSAKKTK